MKRFNLWSETARVVNALVLIGIALCVIACPSHAADNGDKPQLRKSEFQHERYDKKDTSSEGSSASVSSSSSSQSDSNGNTQSHSTVQGTATGNASAAGSASGKAISRKTVNDRDGKSSEASSSARAKIKGNDKSPDQYRNMGDHSKSFNKASSTSTITKNGIRVTRSVNAGDDETLTKLDVIDRSEKISVLQSSHGTIEVRVRDGKKNADGSTNETVYSAATRDDLKQQSPELVRKIEFYEKMAGPVSASVDARGGIASSGKKGHAAIGKKVLDAKQMMRDQLGKMLKQNAGNPEVEKLIRKMIQDIE